MWYNVTVGINNFLLCFGAFIYLFFFFLRLKIVEQIKSFQVAVVPSVFTVFFYCVLLKKKCFLGRMLFLAAVPRVAIGELTHHATILAVRCAVLVTLSWCLQSEVSVEDPSLIAVFSKILANVTLSGLWLHYCTRTSLLQSFLAHSMRVDID